MKLRTGKLKILISLSTVLMVVYCINVSAEEDKQGIDAKQWNCMYCEYEMGTSTSLELGLGYVAKDSYKFGEYNGLQEKGLFVIGDIESRYRNSENASYWDVSVTDLGLDTRSLELEGGKQGRYKLSFFYNELTHYISDSARTPFTGSDENQLSLRPGWVYAGSTTGMTALASDLRDISLDTQRTQTGVGATYIPARHWETSINFRHETKEGTQRIAGSFYFIAAELVQPVDYITDTIDVAASFSGDTWQTRLSYHGSSFKNDNDYLRWENPYTPVVPGATEGQMSLPPDNEFHQVQASVALRAGETSRLMADVAFGRMTQNESFLAATTNSMLTVPALPANSLDGRVDTITANMKWNTDFSNKFRVNAAYRYSDRDNRTPVNTYDWVITDINTATPRSNVPYSYTKNTFKINGEYRLENNIKSSLGYDYQQYDRTYQEVEKSREQTLWASLIGHALEDINLTTRVAHAKRDKDGYQEIAGVDSPENPLMRKYNMADRNRDTFGMRVDIPVSKWTNFGFNIDLSKDHYPGSSIGLTSSHESILGLDLSTQLTMNTTFNIYCSFEKISSEVSGSQLYSIADWSGSMSDQFNTAGMGINHILMNNRADIGIDYVFTHSLSEVSINEGGSGSQLPDLETTSYGVKLYGNYRVSDKLELKGTYWYEYFSSSDWAFDGVGEATIPNTLSLGQESPSYNVHVLMLSMRYTL